MSTNYRVAQVVTDVFTCEHPGCLSKAGIAYLVPREGEPLTYAPVLNGNINGFFILEAHPSARLFCEKHLPRRFDTEYKLVRFATRAKGGKANG